MTSIETAMNNSAQENHVDNLSSEGLEAIFDDDSQMATTTGHAATTIGQLVVSISEAARILQVPYSTFRRLVKEGKYETISDKKGRPKIVLPSTSGHHNWPDGHQNENHSELLNLITKLSDQLQDANSQLQNANYKIGLLESLVTEKTDQMKLLEDKQRMPWWRKSWLWFIGRSS